MFIRLCAYETKQPTLCLVVSRSKADKWTEFHRDVVRPNSPYIFIHKTLRFPYSDKLLCGLKKKKNAFHATIIFLRTFSPNPITPDKFSLRVLRRIRTYPCPHTFFLKKKKPLRFSRARCSMQAFFSLSLSLSLPCTRDGPSLWALLHSNKRHAFSL